MRPAGRLKLGFYPLPAVEAERIGALLSFSPAVEFSALDPCVGDGVAFSRLLEGTQARAYGIEIEFCRSEQAGQNGIEVLHASTFSVRCPSASLSLLYLNPPYDYTSGGRGNQRLEKLFLEHCFPWLKAKGVLIFVLARGELRGCARLLAENFSELRVFRLTEPECLHYRQVVVLALRRSRREHLGDEVLVKFLCYENTMQSSCLRLMGKKLLVALTMEGKFAGEGLQTLDRDDDMLSSMARELVERNGIGESADAVWRQLNAEHGKLFGLGRQPATEIKTGIKEEMINEEPPSAMSTPVPCGILFDASLSLDLDSIANGTDQENVARIRSRVGLPEQGLLFP